MKYLIFMISLQICLISQPAFSGIFDVITKPACNAIGGGVCDALDDLDDDISIDNGVKVIKDASKYVKDPSKIVKETVKMTVEVEGVLRDVIVRAGESLGDSLERLRKGFEHFSHQAWKEYKHLEKGLADASQDIAKTTQDSLKVRADIGSLKKGIASINIGDLSKKAKLPEIKVDLPKIEVDRDTLITGIAIAAVVVGTIYGGPYVGLAAAEAFGSQYVAAFVTSAIISGGAYCSLVDNPNCDRLKMPSSDPVISEIDQCKDAVKDESLKNDNPYASKIWCLQQLTARYISEISQATYTPIKKHIQNESDFIKSRLRQEGAR